MKTYQNILIESQGDIITVYLNRPEVHNAMNKEMIAELTHFFQSLANHDPLPRLIVMRGKGKSFCAGADLNYMKEIAGFGFEENFQDGTKLFALFESIYNCVIPTLAIVHGSAFGGANGLLAACDIVVATEKTRFAFSEVKLGIAPATIAPFVIKRIGEYGARELMLTGKRFNGWEAAKWNLVNHVVEADKLEEKTSEIMHEFLTAAPQAVRAAKNLIGEVISTGQLEETRDFTARLIATLRASEEGQEGMAAFLEKRKAKWTK
jgi:methylglutaconyl-CoA hydratase